LWFQQFSEAQSMSLKELGEKTACIEYIACHPPIEQCNRCHLLTWRASGVVLPYCADFCSLFRKLLFAFLTAGEFSKASVSMCYKWISKINTQKMRHNDH
jgi:hypothetical protein